VVVADDEVPRIGKLLAERVGPEDALVHRPHHQQQRRLARLAEGLGPQGHAVGSGQDGFHGAVDCDPKLRAGQPPTLGHARRGQRVSGAGKPFRLLTPPALALRTHSRPTTSDGSEW